MKIENKFYLTKKESFKIIPDQAYNLETGETYETIGDSLVESINVSSVKIVRLAINIEYSHITMLWWNSENTYKGHVELNSKQGSYTDITLPQDAYYIGFLISGTTATIYYSQTYCEVEKLSMIVPHYKELKKKYKKENRQMFFRESLDGKITLFRSDYLLVKNASIEDTLMFYIYRNDNLYASASFNKTDCKFDHIKKKVELELNYNDKYSNVLDAFDNTYDLIKLAPALTPLTLTKRCVIQIYIQGERVLSNYAGGSYWETEVDEPIDDKDALTNKYHFSKGPKYAEVSLSGFNFNINTSFRVIPDSDLWTSVAVQNWYDSSEVRSVCQIKFVKVLNAGDTWNSHTIFLLSDGKTAAYEDIVGPGGNCEAIYDSYKIQILISGLNENDGMTVLYESDYLYGVTDSKFILSQGSSLYPMTAVTLPRPFQAPTPAKFNLGEQVIEYQIWGRLLCDTDKNKSGAVTLYDLPYDDFATPRRNYKKCIGLSGFSDSGSLVQITQTDSSRTTPTSYGINDYREYFVWPGWNGYYTVYYYPLARRAWANTSMWVSLGIGGNTYGFELFCEDYYKQYTLKNAYHIGDVIKAILAKIDKTIKHEKTAEYSSFLYGHTGGTAAILGGCDVYITQKTNVLKGEYDQAAQKAEIKLSQIMNMLRDCFRCYWFIDDQHRFRIEHISYFTNGFGYDAQTSQLDLTKKRDKFNKKPVLYCQEEIEYTKSELISHYEFSWADNSTKVMGDDLYIDIKDAYVKGSQTEEINIDGFSADIDYMLFSPDDFSNDGFALLLADSNKKVPIVRAYVKDEKQNNKTIDVYVQNWYASFNNLAWHYMQDISGSQVECNNIENLLVGHTKRCMKHVVEVQMGDINLDINQLVTTTIGDGYIESMSTNIDTNLIELELTYEPN